jgi:hypothetical protein
MKTPRLDTITEAKYTVCTEDLKRRRDNDQAKIHDL